MTIEVSYDGDYPNLCSGTLRIKVDGIEIYNKAGCMYSTGSVWLNEYYGKQIEDGELIWKDAKFFSDEIQNAVKKELKEYKYVPCCGGCICLQTKN